MNKKRTSKISQIDKKELEKIVKECKTIGEILRYFGLSNKGNNYKTIKGRMEADNIDYSHIPLGTNACYFHAKNGISFGGVSARPLEEIMVENSNYSRNHLKKRLLKKGILENKCSICGLGPEWNGKGIVMVLDHINGVSNDNRLENLRMVCPNCNSQLPTFAGRKIKTTNNCKDCGKEIRKISEKCNSCASKERGKNKRKVKDRPSKEEINKMLETMSMCAIGRKYGVSDNAVRKWLK